jgi:hypothetical protein
MIDECPFAGRAGKRREVVAMNRNFLFALGLLTLLVPAAFAQMAAKLDPGSANQVTQRQEMLDTEAQSAVRDMEGRERQSWLNSIANLAKLRIKLAEAWQGMGMSPQGAKVVADAYDPNLAARMHHESLRGKSDEEVAEMLQSAIRQKHYLSANQLLIDYERNRLRIATN